MSYSVFLGKKISSEIAEAPSYRLVTDCNFLKKDIYWEYPVNCQASVEPANAAPVRDWRVEGEMALLGMDSAADSEEEGTDNLPSSVEFKRASDVPTGENLPPRSTGTVKFFKNSRSTENKSWK